MGATYNLKEDKYGELENDLLNDNKASRLCSRFFDSHMISEEERQMLINIIHTLRFAFLRNQKLDQLVEELNEEKNIFVGGDNVKKSTQRENTETREKFLEKLGSEVLEIIIKKLDNMKEEDVNELAKKNRDRIRFIRESINGYLEGRNEYELTEEERSDLFVKIDEKITQMLSSIG